MSGNYIITDTATAAGTITAKAVTITGTVADDKVYDGGTLATLSNIGTVTTGVSGETLLLNGPLTADINFNTKDVATANLVTGTGYSIADGTGLASNYALTSTSATTAASITPKDVTIAGTRIYDATTNFAAGTFGTAGTISALGTETLQLSGTGTVASKDVSAGSQAVDTTGLTLNDDLATGGLASNYTFSGGTQTAMVTPAKLILSGTRVYDGSTVFAGSNLTATGVESETFAVTGAGDTSNLAGRNVQDASTLASLTGLALGASDNGGLAGNYSALSTMASSVDVTARPITLTAPAVIKTYDGGTTYATTGADLAAVGVSAPLVGGDTISAAIIAYVNRDFGLGNKTVTLSGSTIEDGNGGLNYTLLAEYGNSTSTINTAALTIAANPQSKMYGTIDPALTYTTGAFQSGDTAGSVLTGVLSRAAGEDVNSYGITQNTLASNADYAIAYTGNNLTITPATLTVIANAADRLYGAVEPAFSGSVTGFVAGDTQAGATTGSEVFSTNALLASNVGSYSITGAGLSANDGNYVFTQAAGNATALTITPATLTVTANAADRLYGAVEPAFSGSVTGFVAGDTQAGATTGSEVFSTNALLASNVGSYSITGAGLSANDGNYVFTQAAGNATALSITPATLTVTANAADRLYGAVEPAFSGSVTGFVAGDTQAGATTGNEVFSTNALLASNVGSYSITGAGLSANDGNYVFTQAAGNATALTINPATLNNRTTEFPHFLLDSLHGSITNPCYGSIANRRFYKLPFVDQCDWRGDTASNAVSGTTATSHEIHIVVDNSLNSGGTALPVRIVSGGVKMPTQRDDTD